MDLTLCLNGIPIITAELKNPMTGQNVRHAITQYQTDRDPNVLIFQFKKARWSTSPSIPSWCT